MKKQIIIGGIKHTKVNSKKKVNFQKMKSVDFKHPFGRVYFINKFGYVANGYDWYKLKMYEIKK